MSMSKRKEKRKAEEKKYRNVKQPMLEQDETRTIEGSENQDPALKRYLESYYEREAKRKAEEKRKATLLNESEIKAKKKEAEEERAIERKRIEDEKFKKQMRQRR